MHWEKNTHLQWTPFHDNETGYLCLQTMCNNELTKQSLGAFIWNRKNAELSQVCQLDRRHIRKNSNRLFSADDICCVDCPTFLCIATIPVPLNVCCVHFRMRFRLVSTLATPCQSHWYRKDEPHEQNDVCRAPSTVHDFLAPRREPDDFSMWWRFSENSDAAEYLCAFLDDENRMCQWGVRTHSKHRHRELTRTFRWALRDHWKIGSCVPSRRRDCRNLFWCPNKRQISAEWADCPVGRDSVCKLFYPG